MSEKNLTENNFRSTLQVKNILVVRLDSISGLLMTTPAIRALKEAIKNVRITLLTSSMAKSIVSFIPEIDDVILFDCPWIKSSKNININDFSDLVKEIESRKFDASFIFNSFSQSSLPASAISYFAKIPVRVAYSKENPYLLLTDWIPDPEPMNFIRHEVSRQLDLVGAFGFVTTNSKISLNIPQSLKNEIKKLILQEGVDIKKPWIVVHPGASERKRQYPVEDLGKSIEKIVSETGYQVIITGLESEKFLAQSLKKVSKQVYSFAGKTTIGQLAALISLSPLLISNNTVHVHIASAFSVPVVVLYAKTNPQHVPWMVKNEVLYFEVPKELRSKNVFLQSFAFNNNYHKASPSQILNSAKRLLNFSKNPFLPLFENGKSSYSYFNS